MNQLIRTFHLGKAHGDGVTCDECGLSVGALPLLEKVLRADGAVRWQPLPLA
ncbi:MAG TPA: hypothetical protein VGI95_09890 [Caulobacteraceae bacterium]